jgi:4-hydroxy-3-methylbut-2-en-1-yl diphosphate reductase
LVDQQEILHRNWRTKELISIHNYLPKKTPLRVLMTSGASCPDAVVEAVIRKLAGFYQVEEQLEKYIDA